MSPSRSPIVAAQVLTRLNIGGPAQQVRLTVPELTHFDVHCHVLTGPEQDSEGTLDIGDVTRSHIPGLQRQIAPLRDIAAYRDLKGRISGLRPDVVHTHMAKAGAIGRLAARRLSVPAIVHTFHGHVLTGYFGRLTSDVFLRTERRLARRTDQLVAVSSAIRDALLQLGIGDESKWTVVPCAVDARAFAPRPKDNCRKALGLPADRPVVGIAGRLVPIKDHGTFLLACQQVKRRVPDALFVIAGDGDARPILEAQARDLLGDNVCFLGWVEDMPAFFSACDAVVLSSLNEGMPVVLLEAAACGTPVVATDVGGVHEVVLNEETGYLVRARDNRAMADRIIPLLTDDGSSKRMGESARQHALKFSPQIVASKLAELYRGVLERKQLE